ncbi:MAG: hypothetical protein AAF065_02115 [Verrucomicrobiota bacterium]
MKHIFLSLLLALPVLAFEQPTERDVIQAIQQIKENILDSQNEEAGKVLIRFAQTSPKVKIIIGKLTAPWADEEWGFSKDRKATLKYLVLISYLAGNIEDQLERENALDNPYAGWLVVIDSYEKLKQNINFKSDSIERLAALKAAELLERHAREVRRALY